MCAFLPSCLPVPLSLSLSSFLPNTTAIANREEAAQVRADWTVLPSEVSRASVSLEKLEEKFKNGEKGEDERERERGWRGLG